MSRFEKISQAVQKGDLAGIADMVQKALDNGNSPQEIIDHGLIAGMDVVGVRFKNDEMYIPEVLVSAKTMHNGVEVLQPFLAAGGAKNSKVVVLGTVKGDLHDIGKNLVGMMFEGAGFEVVDIGVDQSAENFVEAIRRSNAQALAMSALLTTTMPEMGVVISAIKEAGLNKDVKVIIGGAPVTDEFATSIGADGYAPDAGSAVDKLKELIA
ncbi:B12-binding domain-containing protein [Thermodesulfobacteriota bacterium]